MTLRISRLHKSTYTMSVNDYGLEVLSSEPLDLRGLRAIVKALSWRPGNRVFVLSASGCFQLVRL